MRLPESVSPHTGPPRPVSPALSSPPLHQSRTPHLARAKKDPPIFPNNFTQKERCTAKQPQEEPIELKTKHGLKYQNTIAPGRLSRKYAWYPPLCTNQARNPSTHDGAAFAAAVNVQSQIHCRNHVSVLPVIDGVDCSCTPPRVAEFCHFCSEKEAAKDEQPESVKPISDHLRSRSQHGHLHLSSRRNPSRVILCPATGSTY